MSQVTSTVTQVREASPPAGVGAAPTPAGRPRRRSAVRVLAWTVVVISATTPILYLVLVSLSRQSDVLGGGMVPSSLTLANWPRAFRVVDLTGHMRNSLLSAGGGALLTLLIAAPGAYAMGRHDLGGGRLAGIVLGTYIAPPILAVFPLFYLWRAFGLTNSLLGLALVYGLANVPVAVWLLDGFVRRIPPEVEEAARVDGCGIARTLWHIALPLLAPGLVAAGVICFVLGYNELLLASFFTSSTEVQTLPIALALFQGDRQVQFGQMAAASLTAMVPVYVLAVFLQRWLVDGLTSGAVK